MHAGRAGERFVEARHRITDSSGCGLLAQEGRCLSNRTSSCTWGYGRRGAGSHRQEGDLRSPATWGRVQAPQGHVEAAMRPRALCGALEAPAPLVSSA